MVSKSQTNSPKVSAVIVNWNSVDTTVDCLNSLKEIDYPNCEVIVVDNASPDDSADVIEKSFPEVTVLRSQKNLGWGGGTNLGLKHALANETKYIWLLNNDLVVEPDTLSKLVRVAEKGPDAALVSPVLYFYSTRSKIQHCGSIFDWKGYSIRHLNNPDETESVNKQDFWLWCTAILIKREVVETVGYFDEKYFIYFDDMDYSARAISIGYHHKLQPTAKVYHRSHSVDLGGLQKAPLHYFYYMTRNEYWFWKKKVSGLRKFLLIRTYLASVIRKLAFYKKQAWNDIIDACLDGLYCSFRGIGGEWDKSIKMPGILKKLIMWRPYFWVRLFELNTRRVCDRLLGRKKLTAPKM
ncbi:MAG: glycosyltransferase family 2 protein [Sedimentisphaerales bacterium]|nr:glycosyltransferase family 2 protein [Sedimentisphaerales bacterium]